jgi:hypothetical protein
MQSFKSWKLRTIIGSALLGGIYGLVAALTLKVESRSLWEMTASIVGASAVCASSAAAFCRAFEAWQWFRTIRNMPSDKTLCYRGVRHLLPVSDLVSDRVPQSRLVSDGLCYRGVRASSADSNFETEVECHDRSNDQLCYRGIRYRMAPPLSQA